MVRFHRLFPGIQQQEAACTVGIFSHPLVVAHLTEQGRLLVTGDTRHRNTSAALTTNIGLAVHF